MAWQIIKNLFRCFIAIGFALVVLAKTDTQFESIAFIAALIGYHNLRWAVGVAILQSSNSQVANGIWNNYFQWVLADTIGSRELPAQFQVLPFNPIDLGELMRRQTRDFNIFTYSEACICSVLTLLLVFQVID